MCAPAVSLQGQGIVFKEKCIDRPDPVGEDKLVYYAWLVHERTDNGRAVVSRFGGYNLLWFVVVEHIEGPR